MAFSAVTARGSSTVTTSSTTATLSPSANLTVGRFICVTVHIPSIGVLTGARNEVASCVDTKNNVWTKVGEYQNTAGTDGDGANVSMFWTVITTQINTTDTITVTFASSPRHFITAVEATKTLAGVALQDHAWDVAISTTISGLSSQEYLLVGAANSAGSDNAKTPDADFTEQFDLRITGATTHDCHVQTRIATLTTDTCASTGWTNTLPIMILVAFKEVHAANLIETVKISESLAVNLPPGNLSRDVTAESLKLAEIVTPTLDPLETGPAESLKGAETITVVLDLGVLPGEDLRLAAVVAPTLDPLETGPAEAVMVADVPAAVLDPLETAGAESARLADTASTVLDPLETVGAESLRVADVVGPALQLAVTAGDEGLRVSDTVIAAFAQTELVESVSVSDTVLTTLDPLESWVRPRRPRVRAELV
jgi:hypothetical protein